MMEYKGHAGKVEFDDEAGIFHGDVITFQGTTVDEVRQAFHDSVDDYLDFCAQLGQAPEKPFTGKFVLRLSPDLHAGLILQQRPPAKASTPGSPSA